MKNETRIYNYKKETISLVATRVIISSLQRNFYSCIFVVVPQWDYNFLIRVNLGFADKRSGYKKER